MKSDELREKYLAFFETKDHTRCPSDVLVPTWDPSVLFTPAGMNQFKDHFLGKVKLDYSRATTSQKCLRTGDIDNVGRTAYHHTFFEMLGNFSFGDYFKREAIVWAWEFLTDPKWLGMDPDRLTVSVYLDDDEAADIWARDVGLSSDRIGRMGEEENFWPANCPSQGPDGVCGPCSEIFFRADNGAQVEIWNLVFTQFNRVGEPPNNLRPLPSKNIDTGMGLERTAAVLQGVETNFHIDILRPIVEAAAEVCGVHYDPASDQGRRLRRITDHIRACTFAIHENVYPGAHKQKYVVRRLLRRAVLDGHQIGCHEPFLYQLVPVVAQMMKQPYPELTETQERVAQVVAREEQAFFATIDDGLARIEKIFANMQGSGQVMVDGIDAADLYQTYGVPPELTESMAAERNLTFDWDGFNQAMLEHGVHSGPDRHELFKTGPIESLKKAIQITDFLGYETNQADAEVKGIVALAARRGGADQLRDTLVETGKDHGAIVVLDRTPFYGQAGGQVGDVGEIVAQGLRFQVVDTQRDGDLILHHGFLTEGRLHTGDHVLARVDTARRQAIRRAHSATHLLHHALQQNLGEHAQQQGSKVDDDWLRFDFTNLAPVSREQLQRIEKDVCQHIAAASPIRWQTVPLSEARAAGAMMLFGEKYPDPVRMVTMGDFSRELCGGTHLDNTREVESFEVISEEGVSAGTRRIVAYTGQKARQHAQRAEQTLRQTADKLRVGLLDTPAAVQKLSKTLRDLKKQLATGSKGDAEAQQPAPGPAHRQRTPTYEEIRSALREVARTLNVPQFEIPQRVEALLAEVRELEKRWEALSRSGNISAEALLQTASEVGSTRVIAREAPGANPSLMRQLIDQLRQKASPIAVLLAARQDDKVVLVAGVSKELVQRGVSAGDWVRQVAQVVGGGGGGKPDMAQAGGKQPEKLPEALQLAQSVMRQMLA